MTADTRVMLTGTICSKPRLLKFKNNTEVSKFFISKLSGRVPAQFIPAMNEMATVECEALNRLNRDRLADFVNESFKPGDRVYIDGAMKIQTWRNRFNEQRSKLLIGISAIKPADGAEVGAAEPAVD